ncbi:MAG: roadblock/LC7 domain-containing protein [Pseudomonadota bacterium]
MGFFIDLLKISKINGVAHYIFVDTQGDVIAHNMIDYQKIGPMISFCGNQSFAIGKRRLKFLIFSRKNQKDLLIFPVGNYYLGVIKQKEIKTVEIADNVLIFFTALFKKTGSINSLNKRRGS